MCRGPFQHQHQEYVARHQSSHGLQEPPLPHSDVSSWAQQLLCKVWQQTQWPRGEQLLTLSAHEFSAHCRVNPREATGSDGVPGCILRDRAELEFSVTSSIRLSLATVPKETIHHSSARNNQHNLPEWFLTSGSYTNSNVYFLRNWSSHTSKTLSQPH